jgi:hypothetical protein
VTGEGTDAPTHVDAWAVKTLFVLNDPPYGSERSYNGLWLANALAKREGEQVPVFLMADAVGWGWRGGRADGERLLQPGAAPPQLPGKAP